MARGARRTEQVTVAELLVRSAATRERYRPVEDTVVLPRSRHREKPAALRALARTRVFSVVAGALALAGGVAAAATSAVSTPVQRSSELVWPPLDAGVPMVAASPNYPGGTGGAGKTDAPDSGVGVADPAENSAPTAGSASDSGETPGRHGKPAKLAKAVRKVEDVGKGVGKAVGKPATPPGQQAKPVRHDIPEVPNWAIGRPVQQTPWAFSGQNRRDGGGHRDCGGGGRHRR